MCAPSTPSVQAWRGLCEKYGSDLGDRAVDRLLAWIGIESCGNPCSLDATRHAALASGHVPDVGPFQLYFESADTRIAGYSSADLRAGCIGTTQIGAVSDATRDLQARVSIQWLRGQIERQNARLEGLGVSWGERDMWRWYKFSTHGLPAVALCLMPIVIDQLGRPPEDWDEFRSVAEGIDPTVLAAAALSPAANGCTAAQSVRHLWGQAFDNAEKMDLADESDGGPLLPIAAIIVLAIAFFFFGR